MKIHYVSHPYTGNEEYNKKEAEVFATMLAKKFPNELFINPLSALAHTGNADLPYDTILNQCLNLLSVCNDIIMTGDWDESKGCKEEYRYAFGRNMPVYELGDFLKL